MAGVVKFSEGAHWYDCRNGEPKPKHDADLRVARKELLYPSVTTIDKAVFKNDFLDKWKIEQVLLAAASTYKQPHESAEDYCQRIYDMSLDKPRDAADFGTRIHAAIERYPSPCDPELLPWFNRYHQWHEENIASTVSSEKIMVDHELGIAGRGDRVVMLMNGVRSVMDYKTQGVKVDDKGRKCPAFYESWVRQLAFYGVCDAKETKSFPDSIPTAISLIFDSKDPESPLFVKLWDKGEVIHAYRQFVLGAWLWFSGNNKRKAFFPGLTGPWRPEFSIPMPT